MENSKVYFLYMEGYEKRAYRTPERCIQVFNTALRNQEKPESEVVATVVQQDLDTGIRCIHTQIKATMKAKYDVDIKVSPEDRENTHTISG